MGSAFDIPSSWRGIKSVEEAKRLVDYGILLTWKEAKLMKRVFSDDKIADLAKHFAIRLAERVENRLPEEILVESLLILTSNFQSEKVLSSFLEELLLQPNQVTACNILTEISLTCDLSDSEHHDELFSMAVAIICELGAVVRSLKERYPEEIPGADRIMSHISTYLMSVSNSSNPCIRLSLVHYFGVSEQGKADKPGFNRIMGRFGHTVLEHLFVQLFNKKTEGVALQYLLENLPFVLEGDNHCQNILHETLKFYMLKKPDRFCLFIHTLAQRLRSQDISPLAKQVFLKHLGVLVKLVSDLNHKDLGREILTTIVSFDGENFRDDLIGLISQDTSIKPFFVQTLEKLIRSHEKGHLDSVVNSAYRTGKRGRRPSFAKFDDLKPIDQVYFLGQRQVARAS